MDVVGEGVRRAKAFVAETRGAEWDAERVVASRDAMFEAAQTPQVVEAVSRVLLARLEAGSVADGDALAYVALAAGACVEEGVDPRPLARVLARHLPEVLVRARRCADACLAHPSLAPVDDEDAPDETEDDPWIAYVDGVGIPRSVFRSTAAEPGGRAALAYLNTWVLPAVASWTRAPEVLRALADVPGLVDAVRAMRDSDAHWLEKLLAAQVDAPWRLVVFVEPGAARVFEARVDQVTTNFELHAQVERALAAAGLATDPERGGHVAASFELGLPEAAAAFATAKPNAQALPGRALVWREGLPTDVPVWSAGGLEPRRTLVVAPASIQRSWSSGQTFHALTPSVRIERELAGAEVRAVLAALGV